MMTLKGGVITLKVVVLNINHMRLVLLFAVKLMIAASERTSRILFRGPLPSFRYSRCRIECLLAIVYSAKTIFDNLNILSLRV
jgi:hypothetical protein